MLSRLFKSSRQRELERDIAIKRAFAKFRQHIAKLQKHEEQFMEKALRAKKAGDKANFSYLCSMVAGTMNQRRNIESYLLRMETMEQTRDRALVYKDLGQAMNAMSKSIRDASQQFNAEEVIANVHRAIEQSEGLDRVVDEVMQVINVGAMPEGAVDGGVSAADVERILGTKEVAGESVSVDKEIDAGLKAIERELAGEV